MMEAAPPHSVLKRLYKAKIDGLGEHSNVCSSRDAYRRLIEGDISIIFPSELKHREYEGILSLYMSDAVKDPLAFGLRKDSEFRGLFSYHLTRMVEAGLLSRIRNKWLPELDKTQAASEDALTLGYNNLVFPCLIMVVGIAGGLCLGIPE